MPPVTIGLDFGDVTDVSEFELGPGPPGLEPLDSGGPCGTEEESIPGLLPPTPGVGVSAPDEVLSPLPPRVKVDGAGPLPPPGLVGVVPIELVGDCLPGAVKLAPLELDCVAEMLGFVGVATPGREIVPWLFVFVCGGLGPRGAPDGGSDEPPGVVVVVEVAPPGGRGGMQLIPEDPGVHVGNPSLLRLALP
jgi:hypothetical protein